MNSIIPTSWIALLCLRLLTTHVRPALSQGIDSTSLETPGSLITPATVTVTESFTGLQNSVFSLVPHAAVTTVNVVASVKPSDAPPYPITLNLPLTLPKYPTETVTDGATLTLLDQNANLNTEVAQATLTGANGNVQFFYFSVEGPFLASRQASNGTILSTAAATMSVNSVSSGDAPKFVARGLGLPPIGFPPFGGAQDCSPPGEAPDCTAPDCNSPAAAPKCTAPECASPAAAPECTAPDCASPAAASDCTAPGCAGTFAVGTVPAGPNSVDKTPKTTTIENSKPQQTIPTGKPGLTKSPVAAPTPTTPVTIAIAATNGVPCTTVAISSKDTTIVVENPLNKEYGSVTVDVPYPTQYQGTSILTCQVAFPRGSYSGVLQPSPYAPSPKEDQNSNTSNDFTGEDCNEDCNEDVGNAKSPSSTKDNTGQNCEDCEEEGGTNLPSMSSTKSVTGDVTGQNCEDCEEEGGTNLPSMSSNKGVTGDVTGQSCEDCEEEGVTNLPSMSSNKGVTGEDCEECDNGHDIGGNLADKSGDASSNLAGDMGNFDSLGSDSPEAKDHGSGSLSDLSAGDLGGKDMGSEGLGELGSGDHSGDNLGSGSLNSLQDLGSDVGGKDLNNGGLEDLGNHGGSDLGSGLGDLGGSDLGSGLGSGLGDHGGSDLGSGLGDLSGSDLGSGLGSGLGDHGGSDLGSGLGSGLGDLGGSDLGSGLGDLGGAGLGSGGMGGF